MSLPVKQTERVLLVRTSFPVVLTNFRAKPNAALPFSAMDETPMHICNRSSEITIRSIDPESFELGCGSIDLIVIFFLFIQIFKDEY